jgi:hypothetical protein
VYDMYSWDQPVSPPEDNAETGPAPRAAGRPGTAAQAAAAQAAAAQAAAAQAAAAQAAAGPTQPASAADARAARAVQVALDRRDNGGDAGPGRPR